MKGGYYGFGLIILYFIDNSSYFSTPFQRSLTCTILLTGKRVIFLGQTTRQWQKTKHFEYSFTSDISVRS